MSNKQIHKIYSTNLTINSSTAIEIETIILNGLYRFSILGINQKNSSDIKDRVYSALRSQKLINLKSDNKKITVNLLPTNIDKKSNIYDLGIALSCLIHMGQIGINENILAVGELSIVGNIISSNCILRSIHQAIVNNIHCIVCSYGDIEALDTYKNNLNDLIDRYELRFIVADTLGELIENIKGNIFYIFKFKETNIIAHDQHNKLQHFSLKDENIFKIVLAISTNRNIFIQNKKESYINKFLRNLIYYTNRLNNDEILKMSNNLNKTDVQLLDKYTHPIVSIIDNQTQKDEVETLLHESLFCFNLIENFISIPEDILHITKKMHMSSIICFYNVCPCGNNNNLFNGFFDDKCLCLQRNILKYRQKIQRLENRFFDFYIKDIDNIILDYKPTDYININKIISRFRNISVNIDMCEEMKTILSDHGEHYEKADLDTIIKLAKDITKLKYVLDKTKKPILNKDNIDLAVTFLKKGF